MNTRASFLALILGTTALTSAYAQNYEYDNPNWFDGGPTQPNLAQIGVTPTFHSDFKAYIDGSAYDTNVIVAVLDGLADFNHIDINGQGSVQIVYNSRFRRYSDHGTHVSGIVAAAQNDVGIVGVNPYATLLNIPVFDGKKWLPKDLGAVAFDAAEAAGAIAVNMSYGPASIGGLSSEPFRGPPPGKGPGGGGDDPEPSSGANLFFDGELNLFTNYDMVFVRAAGNDGIDIGNEPFSGNAAVDLSHLLVVGSVDGNNLISGFSNTPGAACIGGAAKDTCSASDSNAMMNFFLVAPGESIVSDLPNNYVGTMSGTSMSAPHVAGAAAMVYQYALAGNTTLTAGDVASIIKLSADDLGDTGVDGTYGHGLLNVERAVNDPVGPAAVPIGGTVEESTSLEFTNIVMSSVVNSAAFETAFSGMLVLDQFKRAFVVESPKLKSASSPFDTNIVERLSASVSAFPTTTVSDNQKVTLVSSNARVVDGGFGAVALDKGNIRLDGAMGASSSYLNGPYSGGASASRSVSLNMAEYFLTGSGDVSAALDKAVFFGADWRLDSRLTLSGLFLRTAPEDLYLTRSGPLGSVRYQQAESSLVKFGGNYEISDSVSFGMSYGLLSERNQLLGMRSSGALGFSDGTTHMGTMSVRAVISETTFFSAFAEKTRTTSPALSGSILGSVDGWSGSKFGIGFVTSDVFNGNDFVRLKLASPWQIDGGQLAFRLPVGRELDGTVNYEDRFVSFGADGMPWEVGLEYLTGNDRLKYGFAFTATDYRVAGRDAPELSAAAALRWAF